MSFSTSGGLHVLEPRVDARIRRHVADEVADDERDAFAPAEPLVERRRAGAESPIVAHAGETHRETCHERHHQPPTHHLAPHMFALRSSAGSAGAIRR